MRVSSILLVVLFALVAEAALAEQPAMSAKQLFARQNLIAWCVVPFDAKHRAPEERAVMLEELGFTKFAYDWRTEHLPTFEQELKSLRKHHITLVACWFPPELNDEARKILAVLKQHKQKPQLWVALGQPPTKATSDEAKIDVAVKMLKPVVEAAASQGSQVGLYNHGGWYGEPESQLAILHALDAPNVGLVYNLHHGHDHVARLAKVLTQMKPRLLAINIKGMDRDGERRGRKILPLGQGELDLELLRTIVESGYRGPIGILGHTEDDARLRLEDNLEGLSWLVKQLEGGDAGGRPKPRTPVPPKTSEISSASS